MHILVWGLGCPGLVCAGSLAKLGHTVTGIDADAGKVDTIRAGRSPYAETGLGELIAAVTEQRLLSAAKPVAELVQQADVSFVYVGTPPLADGTLNTAEVAAVAETIGTGLRRSTRFHTIAVRSTVPPGFTRGLFKTRLETASGLIAGEGFGLAICPEFLREGSALSDFRASFLSVIGAKDGRSPQALRDLTRQADQPSIEVSFEEAEMLKLASNAFHALKTGFANEIGRLSASQMIDPERVMDLLCRDTRLNLSRAYLQPGFPFGGSCLSKDLLALLHLGGTAKLPILDSILPSNREHLDRCLAAVRRTGWQKIGFLGIAFKAGTDDLRQSPALQLAAQLQREGLSIQIYDPDLRLDQFSPSNRELLAATLVNYEAVLVPDLDGLIRSSELLVVTQRRPEFASLNARVGARQVVDLADACCGWSVG